MTHAQCWAIIANVPWMKTTTKPVWIWRQFFKFVWFCRRRYATFFVHKLTYCVSRCWMQISMQLSHKTQRIIPGDECVHKAQRERERERWSNWNLLFIEWFSCRCSHHGVEPGCPAAHMHSKQFDCDESHADEPCHICSMHNTHTHSTHTVVVIANFVYEIVSKRRCYLGYLEILSGSAKIIGQNNIWQHMLHGTVHTHTLTHRVVCERQCARVTDIYPVYATIWQTTTVSRACTIYMHSTQRQTHKVTHTHTSYKQKSILNCAVGLDGCCWWTMNSHQQQA